MSLLLLFNNGTGDADTILGANRLEPCEIADPNIVLAPKIAAILGGYVPPDYVQKTIPWLSVVVAAWTPLDAAPVLARNLSPGIPGVSVDAPPPSSSEIEQLASVAWPTGWDVPIVKGKLSPGIPGQSVDAPPASSNAGRQLARGGEWPVGWSVPIVKGKASPGIPGQSVDQPPVSSTVGKQRVAEWPAGWAVPLVKASISAAIPGQSVDAPTGLRRPAIAWPVDPFNPILPRNLAAGAPGQSIDAPPPRRRGDVTGWDAQPVHPQTAARFVQFTADSPPIDGRRWLSGVVSAWAPGAVLLPIQARLVQPFTPSVDNPPQRQGTQQFWTAVDAQPQQPRPLLVQGEVAPPPVIVPPGGGDSGDYDKAGAYDLTRRLLRLEQERARRKKAAAVAPYREPQAEAPSIAEPPRALTFAPPVYDLSGVAEAVARAFVAKRAELLAERQAQIANQRLEADRQAREAERKARIDAEEISILEQARRARIDRLMAVMKALDDIDDIEINEG